MTKTYVILDGLEDCDTGRSLSKRWAQAGFHNAVDVAGQCAWLAVAGDETEEDSVLTPLNETTLIQAADIARSYGLAVRDRIGNAFNPNIELPLLRRQMAGEYRSRLATTLVFGLPAVVLHYLGPILAGGVVEPRSLTFAWLIEGLLVSWGCIAAGWPILWQGGCSLVRLRTSGDALTTLIVLFAWGPSMIGLTSLLFTDQPWLIDVSTDGGDGLAMGLAFHAAMAAVFVAVLQRWLVYRHVDRLAGNADLMIPKWHMLVFLWLMLSLGVMAFSGWFWGLATAMLLPAVAGLGAINPWSPGWSAVLPVFGFAGVFLLGPTVMQRPVSTVAIEIAAGFNLIMTLVFFMGWRALHVTNDHEST